MTLAEIYRCLGDETRLRMMHLLAKGPLCVCHFQSVLQEPQVAISKHLAYLRNHGMVTAQRHEQWMIYQLSPTAPPELARQLRCLEDCAASSALMREDLKRLKKLAPNCAWVERVATPQPKKLAYA